MCSRPVAARATRTAVIVASVPELQKRTASAWKRRLSSSASRTVPSVGAAKCVPVRAARTGTHFAAPTEPTVHFAEVLCARFACDEVRFANSGTEATMSAIRVARAATGRDHIVKIEGSYHGHHDPVMFSVVPGSDLVGGRDAPSTTPMSTGIPKAVADYTHVVPFNDLELLGALLADRGDEIACLILEPVMMNIGICQPQPGYLQGLKDLCHDNGAYLAFDEVKTGATLAYGGAVESFGVVPDVICLAKAIGGGTPCGAIGSTEDLYGPVIRGEYDMAGTFNGNPLTMAASRATLTEVLVPEAYEHFTRIDKVMKDGLNAVVEKYELPCYVTGLGAKGSVIYSSQPVREYRDAVGIDERISYLAWLFQQNRGVFKSPWTKQETWTLSVAHTEDDASRYIANFEEFASAVTS